MLFWESFEATHQVHLSPLLADTTQRPLFKETNRCHERMFMDFVVNRIKPSHFFEIGAYEAAAARRVAVALPGTKCYAFEADPDVHSHFAAKHTLIPNFTYVLSAMSDTDGVIAFQKQAVISGKAVVMLMPNNSIKKKSLDIDYVEVNSPCHRLDTYVQGMGPITNAVLRIDVEGLCYEVLKGARQTLAYTSAIYAEVEDYEVWKQQKTVFDIYPYLEEMGFVPVSRDVQSPGQYNVLWLRHTDSFDRKYRSRLALYFMELQQIAARALLKK